MIFFTFAALTGFCPVDPITAVDGFDAERFFTVFFFIFGEEYHTGSAGTLFDSAASARPARRLNRYSLMESSPAIGEKLSLDGCTYFSLPQKVRRTTCPNPKSKTLDRTRTRARPAVPPKSLHARSR